MISFREKDTKNSGQALVEFALILIVLLLLLTMVIELGRIFWAWSSVQTAARSGARYAITGQAEIDACDGEPVGCLARTESIEEVALRNMAGLRVEQDVAFEDDYFTAVEIFGFNSALPAGQQMQLGYGGEPGQPVVVRVTYNVPIITPLLDNIVQNVPVFQYSETQTHIEYFPPFFEKLNTGMSCKEAWSITLEERSKVRIPLSVPKTTLFSTLLTSIRPRSLFIPLEES